MGEGSGTGPTPAELKTILAKLDEMLAEAERLRLQIERQMADQRSQQRQKIARPRRRRSPRSS